MPQKGNDEMLEPACVRTMAMTCVAAILILAGSPTDGFGAEGGLWGAFSMYRYVGESEIFEGYGVKHNSPTKAEAIATALEKCQEREKEVPAHVRQSAVPDYARCRGHIVPFSTSVPEKPGRIEGPPGIWARHARCMVVTVDRMGYFSYKPTSDVPAFVEWMNEFNSREEIIADNGVLEINSISCNDR